MSAKGHIIYLTRQVEFAAAHRLYKESFTEAENFKNAYLKLLPLLHFTYSAINPVAVKSLMKALGLPAGELRKPLTGLDGEALAKGVRIVQELGLDKQYGYKVGPLSAVAA